MITHKFILFFLSFILLISGFAQEETISLDSLNLKGQKLLFEKYETTGKNCKNNNGLAKFCSKEIRLFDNNIEDLNYEYHDALSYLYSNYEIINKDSLDKIIYEDLNTYRYFIQYKPTASKAGNSCFSNPGSLLIEFYLLDRVLNKKYKLDIKYAFFICDIQLLVNKINERLEDQELENQKAK
ncbi:MAG: hypothetical protein ACPGVH_04930 [Chitinophagales bacterium]